MVYNTYYHPSNSPNQGKWACGVVRFISELVGRNHYLLNTEKLSIEEMINKLEWHKNWLTSIKERQ